MNRYLRMGTRRSGASCARPQGVDGRGQELPLELGAVRDGTPDAQKGATAAPARAWSGERSAYVTVRAPKNSNGRG